MEELKKLVVHAQAGDLDAYAEVIRRFQDMACGFAYSILGDFHLAEDAAQEAFVQAYRDLSQLREPAAFPGWFRTIVFKHCDRLTRGKRLPAAPIEAAEGVASSHSSPAEAAERSEMKDKVLDAVKSLPPDERTVTTLFYINGYSQKDIADFLEVPVTTVKNRMHASRKLLKERMMEMAQAQLRENAPGERFSAKVIERLLARPRPLEIEGHPVRRIWEQIRSALPEYEVIVGSEVEERAAHEDIAEDMYRAYHVDKDKMLRTQMTVTTFKAIHGRKPPVRLLAAGRVFRPDEEGPTRAKVFHQADGICIQAGADRETLKSTVERALTALFGPVPVRWKEHDFGFVQQGCEVDVQWRKQWLEVAGCGILRAETLQRAGYDAKKVGGFAFGLGLDRLAMLKLGITDIRKLWQPPYVR